MPKPRAQEPRDQQLLVRLTARQQAVLESVAHLERTTPNHYAHRILVDHLAKMTTNPRVRADLDNREAYSQDLAATTPLPRLESPLDDGVSGRGVADPIADA